MGPLSSLKRQRPQLVDAFKSTTLGLDRLAIDKAEVRNVDVTYEQALTTSNVEADGISNGEQSHQSFIEFRRSDFQLWPACFFF